MKANKFLHNASGMHKNKSGSIDMVNTGIMLVVLLVVLYVGLQIIDNVIGAAGLASGDTFYNTSVALTNTTESSFAMAGIMPIVMIAVAVLAGLLGILYLFRRD